MSRVTSALAAAGLMLGCIAAAHADAPTSAASVVAFAGTTARGAAFADVRSGFVEGERIGTLHSGANCSSTSEREWSELVRQRVELELPQVFQEEMLKAGATFAPRAGAAPLQVQAFLNDMDVKVCQAAAGAWQGAFHVQVGWQIVSPDSGRVLYRASTEGSFSQATPQRNATSAALRQAFAESVRKLLADRRFTAMVDGSAAQLALAD